MEFALPPELSSIPGVCDVRFFPARDASAPRPPDLLIEIPHGATLGRHFDELRRKMVSPLPSDLIDFFFVNTDVGAPETAEQVAALLAENTESARSVLVLRGLIPRTLVDCNRALELGAKQNLEIGLTPALPDYVSAPEDADLLASLYGTYQCAAEAAYELVCGNGGLALILHTYAPRSIQIERVDRNIVEQLRAAYEPERYARWPIRPDVDLITEDSEGRHLAPRHLVDGVRRGFADIGIRVAENATYRLLEATMGHRHSVRFPDRVLCAELNRELLVELFTPFEEMQVSDTRARRVAEPLAAALHAAFSPRGRAS